MSDAKDEASTASTVKASSKNPSSTKGNHMSIIALQANRPDGQPKTMTSREIAVLTGKEHKHVIRDIRAMLDELEKDGPVLDHPQEDKDARGYTTCFYLNRELTDTLLTGYSVVARNRVIKRWHELEDQIAKPSFVLPDFTNPAIAARAWADVVEQKQVLELKSAETQKLLEVAQPKVEAFNRLAGGEGAFNLQTIGKMLQQPPNKFIQKLREFRWIFKRPGSKHNQAHVDKINAGYLTIKPYEYEKADGTVHINEQVMVTPKGLAKLALLLGVSLDGSNSGLAT